MLVPVLSRSGDMSVFSYALLTPIGALCLMLWTKLVLFFCSFMPVAGPICGFIRLAYYRAFSSVVAQPAPTFHVALWFR